jgi:hypothetical protein
MGRQQQPLILLPPKAQQEVLRAHLKHFGNDGTHEVLLELIHEGFEYKNVHNEYLGLLATWHIK